MGLRYATKSSKYSISLRKGFTLVEILIALSIAAGAGVIFAPKISKTIDEAKLRSDQKDLLSLNQAVEAYRSMDGGLPTGRNDSAQNESVLEAIKAGLNGQKLVSGMTIKADQLESSGQGNNFRFIRYRKATINDIPETSSIASATEPTSTTWFDAGNSIPLEEGATLAGTPTSPDPEFGNKAFLNNLKEMANQRSRNNQPEEKSAFFYTAGNHEFVVPANVKSIKIEAIGGGGSGTQFQHIEEWGAPSIIKNHVSFGYGDYWGNFRCNFEVFAVTRTQFKNVTPNPYSSDSTTDNPFMFHGPNVLNTNIPSHGSSIELQRGEKINFHFHMAFNNDGNSRCHNGALSDRSIVLEKREWSIRDISGQGGSVGEFKREVVNSLNGGETVRITVGAKGVNSNGGITTVNVNGVSITARGGSRGGQPSIHGQCCSTYFGPDGCMHGSGGVGQISATDTRSTDGIDGMVKITYKDKHEQ